MRGPIGGDERRVVAMVDALVAELHPRSAARVRPDSDLERDLGLDSLALAELLARIEEEFGVSLPAEVLRTATTVCDLVGAVAQSPRLEGGAAPTGPGPEREATPATVEAAPERPPRALTTLVESLDWHAHAHPERLHVRILPEDGARAGAGTTELTYGELRAEARSAAAALLDLGVSPGESVALMLPTGRDYYVTFLGVVLAGAVPVPIYPPARPAQLEEHLHRQRHILDNARAVSLVTVPEARVVSRLLKAGVDSLRDVLIPEELQRTGPVDLPEPQPDDVALLQYTSGSTGNPKGVVLTHRHLLANIDAMGRAANVGPDDIFVSWLPLYHDMGLIGAWLGSLHLGMSLVSMSPMSFLIRPARWLEAISEHRATLSAAPNFAYELCLRKIDDAARAALDLRSWRLALNGAEAVHPDTIRRFSERFAPCGLRPEAVLPVYGLAEAAVGLAFPEIGRPPRIDSVRRHAFLSSGRAVPSRPEDPLEERMEFVSCGRPLPGYELRVVDGKDRELPERSEGHLQFRGPSATSGYLRNPEATAALFHGDWLETGDLGYLADGDVHVTGRVKDLIIRAGRNLHPDELEQVLDQVPGVRRGCVAVFAAPDLKAGTERLVVVAETRETDPDALGEIRGLIVAAATDVIGTPPDEIVLSPPGTVPKTSSGKIRRSECRTRYERGELGPHPRAVWRQIMSFAWSGIPVRAHRLRRALADGAHTALGWIVLVGVGLPLWVVLALLPGRRLRYAVARAAARTVLRLTGTRIRIHGEALPDGPSIVVANHASWIDGVVLAAALPGPLRFVAGEVFSRRVLSGFVLRRMGTVFVERWDREQGIVDAGQLAGLAAAGARLMVFPEGHLAPLPGLRPFHLGGFAAAATAGVPVVPVALRGTRWILRPGRRRLRRGSVDIVVGAPVRPPGRDWRAALALRDQARVHILRHCGEPDLT